MVSTVAATWALALAVVMSVASLMVNATERSGGTLKDGIVI